MNSIPVVTTTGTTAATLLAAGLLFAAGPTALAANEPDRPAFELQELERGHRFPGITVAADGTVLAFLRDSRLVRRSENAGKTWGPPIETGVKHRANAIVDENSGDVLLLSPTNGLQWRSRDHGQTWEEEEFKAKPNSKGHGLPFGDIDVHDFVEPDKSPVSAHYHETGITLQYGEHKGRLLMPVRVFVGSNQAEWRDQHYNNAIFSDDGGRTWQVSEPFPVLGTGEGALAELRDGRIYYNSREHMTAGNRYIAWSEDGGATWINPSRCEYLPDGPRAHAYGCAAGLTRLPADDTDILIYSNLDTEGRERRNIVVWASFDGGKTWPVKRSVFEGPSAYSSLAAGRPGTASEGWIYLLFEGGEEGPYAGIQLARFHLAWITDGRSPSDFNDARN